MGVMMALETGMSWMEKPEEYVELCLPIWGLPNVSVWSAIRWVSVVLVIEILLLLNWPFRRLLDCVNFVKPFTAAGPNVTEDDSTERISMYLGKWFAVHFPREQDLVELDFSPWHRDSVVVHLAFLEVRFCTNELKMFGFRFEAAAGFDNLLETYTGPSGSPNGTFSPLEKELAELVIRSPGFLTGALISSSPSPGYSRICSMPVRNFQPTRLLIHNRQYSRRVPEH
jgi:hypothetical protein